MPGYPGGIGVR